MQKEIKEFFVNMAWMVVFIIVLSCLGVLVSCTAGRVAQKKAPTCEHVAPQGHAELTIFPPIRNCVKCGECMHPYYTINANEGAKPKCVRCGKYL